MRKLRDLLRALRRYRARSSNADDHAALLSRLDRINHWVVTIDARQQEQAAVGEATRRGLAAVADGLQLARAEAATRLDQHTTSLTGLDVALGRLEHTLAGVVEQAAWIAAPEPVDGPLVTVICAVRDRAVLFDRALASIRAQTYARWECVVVDDGSADLDAETVRRWCADERVRVVRAEPLGVGAARNRALREGSGAIVAHLDADNTFHPTYLARVVDALQQHPGASWTFAAQLVLDPGSTSLRDDRYDIERLERANHIDINAVAYRRSLLDVSGDFDPSFARLSDWDLVQRLAAAGGDPVRLTAVGSVYDNRRADSISRQVPLHPHLRRIVDRGRDRPADGLRVLFAEWHYPQVSESYQRADVVGLQALGAHIEAWSQEDVAFPYEPGLPVHRGDLAAAIEAVRPDIVVSHWLNIGRDLRGTVAAAGLPLAVRGHGFDFDRGVLDELLADPGVIVHAFPHHLDLYGHAHPRLVPLPVSFDQDLYPPADGKDRRLVVRVGAGLHTKDYDTFFEVAARCPDHRFVLAMCHAYLVENQTDEVIARRDELDAPVEILTDLPHEKAADLVAEAGIYLHTHGTSHPIGMPISIVESLATGCYTLARDLPGNAAYLGTAGDLYRDATHAAALLQQTVHWDEARWRSQWRRASDHAHGQYGTRDVMLTAVRQWDDVLGVRPA